MEEIEAKENKLRVAAAAQQSSTLRIGTLPSITATWLPTLLEQFYAQFPRTAVQLVERDGYDELLTCLQREEVDCTFYVGNHSPAWSAAPSVAGRIRGGGPRNHPLAQQPSVGMEALYPYPFLPSTGRVETSPWLVSTTASPHRSGSPPTSPPTPGCCGWCPQGLGSPSSPG